MLEILSQHTKQNAIWIWESDTLENIYYKLEEEHEIRPELELYGIHINYSPQWKNEETTTKYKGCTYIFTSPYVRLITDDKEIIARCEVAINGYKATEKYKQAKQQYIETEERNKREYQESLDKKFKRKQA